MEGHPPLSTCCVWEPVLSSPASALRPPLSQIPLWAKAEEHRPGGTRTPSYLRAPTAESSLGHLSCWNCGDCITRSPLHRWEAEVQAPAG